MEEERRRDKIKMSLKSLKYAQDRMHKNIRKITLTKSESENALQYYLPSFHSSFFLRLYFIIIMKGAKATVMLLGWLLIEKVTKNVLGTFWGIHKNDHVSDDQTLQYPQLIRVFKEMGYYSSSLSDQNTEDQIQIIKRKWTQIDPFRDSP